VAGFGWCSVFVGLAIGAGDDNDVSVAIGDPNLAMSGTVALACRRVPVWCIHDRCSEFGGSADHTVEIGDLTEPDEYTVAERCVGVTDSPVAVFDFEAVELEYEFAIGEQSLVVRSAVVAAESEEGLIPRTR
jgi:hypothetical protein